MNQQGKQMTLFGLFDDDTVVEIPIVQRDYAQGRESAREIRDGFLCAIFDALSGDCPLDLDFVYGSVSGSSPRKFQPLDGQQRLTTLFLLHWYLAWKDAQTQEFREIARRGAKSRFTYAVRPSSTEFFDFLVGYAPSTTPREGQKLSSMIGDESGFFRSWKLDPTIRWKCWIASTPNLRRREGYANGLSARSDPASRFSGSISNDSSCPTSFT
jgi:hypothetical protein